MKALRRLFGLIALVLSAIGFVVCIAGLVGVFVARQHLSRQVETFTRQLDTGLQTASAIGRSLDRSIETIRDYVDLVKQNPDPEVNLDIGTTGNIAVTAYFHQVLNRLTSFSNAASNVSSSLQDMRELPLVEASHLDADKWERDAAQLSASIEKIRSLVGEEGKDATGAHLVAAAHELDSALAKCKEMADDGQSALQAARADVPRLQESFLRWLTPAALVVAFLCAWGAVSQVSLSVHAWKWLRGT